MDKSPVCFALDFPNLGQAANFVKDHRLHEHLGAVKVGLELFISSGPRAVQVFKDEMGLDVVLDLKLHDIPETVARAVKAGGDLGVEYMTLHVQQRATLEAAVKAAEPFGIRLLGVTVLTSMEQQDLSDLGVDFQGTPVSFNFVSEVVLARAKLGASCGLSGFVCSPSEVSALKAEVPDAFFLVPGVRPAGANIGDQKRVGTPLQAVRDGASMIVVGRPIRDAEFPEEATKDILRELKDGAWPEKAEKAEKAEKKDCDTCAYKCMDMDMDPYCAAVGPFGTNLCRGKPKECGPESLIWKKDDRRRSL